MDRTVKKAESRVHRSVKRGEMKQTSTRERTCFFTPFFAPGDTLFFNHPFGQNPVPLSPDLVHIVPDASLWSRSHFFVSFSVSILIIAMVFHGLLSPDAIVLPIKWMYMRIAADDCGCVHEIRVEMLTSVRARKFGGIGSNVRVN